MQLEISQHAYELLVHEAQVRATTPEALVELLAEELAPAFVAHDEIEFYHGLGLDDTQIAEVMEQARQLPSLPPSGAVADQQFDED